MNNDRIPIDLFNCELEKEDRDRWVHLLWYKDVRERDLKALDIDVSSLGQLQLTGSHGSLP